MIPEKLKEKLEKQQYRIVGNFSVTKICHWTKESIRTNGKRVCYKELWFPPVKSSRCMQMTPYLGCNYNCLHCWRISPRDLGIEWKEFPPQEELDGPKEIVEGCIEKRKELLMGFKGDPNVDKERFKEALKPNLMTLSLTGEPAYYPWIGGLVKEAKKRGMVTFLVTNGSLPERLEKMDPLPWQLYVSVYGPDKKTYYKLARPMIPDAWKRLNKTLELLPSLNTRKVFRILAVKGYNMINPKGYAKLIKKAEPNWIDIKAYEWVGESRKRLLRSAMPSMNDIRNFAKEIATHTDYKIKDEFRPSGVVLLSKG